MKYNFIKFSFTRMCQSNTMRVQSNYNIQKYNTLTNSVLIPNCLKKSRMIKRHFSTFSNPSPKPPPEDPKKIAILMLIIPAVSSYILKKRYA